MRVECPECDRWFDSPECRCGYRVPDPVMAARLALEAALRKKNQIKERSA